MPDMISSLIQSAIQEAIDTDKIADLQKMTQQAIADKMNLTADAQVTAQLQIAREYANKAAEKMKRKSKPLADNVKKAAKVKKGEKPEEVAKAEEKVEEKVAPKTFQEAVKAVRENKQKIFEQFGGELLKLAAKEPELTEDELDLPEERQAEIKNKKAAQEMIEYLVGTPEKYAPFKAYPEDAVGILQFAQGFIKNRVESLEDEVKKGKEKGEDTAEKEERLSVEKAKFERLTQAFQNLLSRQQGPGSSAPFSSIGKVKAYNEKIKEGALNKFAGKTEEELEALVQELSTKQDPQSHRQFCLQIGSFDKIYSLFALFNRQASGALSRNGTNIEPGELNAIMKVIRFNNGLINLNKQAKKNLVVAMKEYHHKVGV